MLRELIRDDKSYSIAQVAGFIEEAIKARPSQPDWDKLTVYEFLYNDNLWESCAGTISIHATMKSAQMALEFHKANIIEQNEWKGLSEAILIERAYWGIRETKLTKQ